MNYTAPQHVNENTSRISEMYHEKQKTWIRLEPGLRRSPHPFRAWIFIGQSDTTASCGVPATPYS